MLGLRYILFIFVVVCFIQGSLAIEVSFSAEDGGESVGISDEYDVSTGISVSEESEAKFGCVEMTNTREVAGSGDINAVQSYSGSGGYTGATSFSTSGSGSLIGSACLYPGSLNANQRISASGSLITVGSWAADGVSKSETKTTLTSAGGVQGSFDGVASLYAGHSTDALISSQITGALESIVSATGSTTSTRNSNGVPWDADQFLHAQTPGTPGVIDRLTFHISPLFRIQPAIDFAKEGDAISVLAGFYPEDVNIYKWISLIGFGNPTANSFSLTNGAQLGPGSGGISAPVVTVNQGSKIQDGILLASNGGIVNVNRGTYGDNLDQSFYANNIRLVGNGDPVTSSISLDRPVGTQISGITANTVNVQNSNAKIQDGVTLASSGGTVNVAAGTYLEDVNVNKGLTLKGFGNPTATSFALNAILGTGSGGISAPTVTVNPNSRILDGILLSSKDVFVNGATGYTYSDDLTQSFYARGITLTGINNPVTNSISLNQIVDGKISGITANTVNVQNSNAKIQDGVTLASSGGTVNIATGTYNENLIINKLLTLSGAGSGDDTRFNTLIYAADKSKSVISIVTGGVSEDNRLIVKDLQVTGATSSSGISINGVGDISHITLDNIASTGNYNGADFSALGSGNSISDVIISNSQFTNSGMSGVNIDARNHGSIGNVEIKDSIISDSGENGVRVNAGVRYSSDSRVSGTIGSIGIKGCTISNSGSSGVDVRAYSGSTIGNVEIAGSVISGAGDSGVYGGSYYGGTTIGNIGITKSTISGCDRGLSMGATDGGINNNIALTDSIISNSRYDGIWTAAANGGTIGKLGITGSTITGSGWNGVSTKTWAGGTIGKLEAHDSNIYGNSEFGIMNQAGTTFDATNNWWGNGGTGVNAGKPGEEGNNRAGSVLYTPGEALRRSYGQTTSQTLGVVTYTPWSTSEFLEAP